MNRTVGFGNCFLQDPLLYQPCYLEPCCQSAKASQGIVQKRKLPNLLNCLSNKLITRTFTSAGDINPGLALVITTRPISLKMTPESCRRSRHRRPGSGDPREILLPAVEVHPERLPGLRTRGRDIPTPQACDVVIVSSLLLSFRDHLQMT